MAVSVPIPGVQLKSESNLREHHYSRSRRAKSQREIVTLVLRGTVAKEMMLVAPLAVTITRIGPSARGLDSDNLQGSGKHVRDAIAEILGVDDSDPRVTWNVIQRRGPWGIEIDIRPAAEPNTRKIA